MITKKLVKDIQTLNNKFIHYKGIYSVCNNINTKDDHFIIAAIKLWNDNFDIILISVYKEIHNYDEFKEYKQEVEKKFFNLLNK